eukprot:g7303.t1
MINSLLVSGHQPIPGADQTGHPLNGFCKNDDNGLWKHHYTSLVRDQADFFLNCKRENAGEYLFTKLNMSKAHLAIAELVDLSAPLMEKEGEGFKESTNYSTISMKHTNRQLTIIDVVVVQAMSRKMKKL